ncbi:hypothetical protein GCM10007938_40030 [Vibrio zhanjiangensis]|uniref:Uncharacterized protein n=1 Tax=Vibrio zhanjiangensis TaxID=1046128 RepID=A0ABQ6F5T1_9VIBR|nr:hypothetical protein [Vibrio zhanjiangensis]GLT20220.1 hypothetical protein GCM10007938_40030 [Vibrio zhanjiangensis]
MANMSRAIVLLRQRLKARQEGDAAQLTALDQDIAACQPYVWQVQQALKFNTDGMTLSKVYPSWVKARLRRMT